MEVLVGRRATARREDPAPGVLAVHGYFNSREAQSGYLRSLNIVDKENVGLEGHSMGGWTVVNAAAAMPDACKALVLEGSSTGKPFAPEGSTEVPRNMWQVPTAAAVGSSKKLQAVFGTDAPVEPGRVYGSLANGSARVLCTPAITYPMDHISPTAIGHSNDRLQRTLRGGAPRPADDQTSTRCARSSRSTSCR